MKRKLNQIPVHNLNEERNVGFINYELNMRGQQNLKSASKETIINKSIDILKNSDPPKFKAFIKPAMPIKELKLEWKSF